MTRSRLIEGWFAAVVLAAVAGVAFGPAVTISTWALLFVQSLIPPAVVLMVWPKRPALTVAEVLHDADRRA